MLHTNIHTHFFSRETKYSSFLNICNHRATASWQKQPDAIKHIQVWNRNITKSQREIWDAAPTAVKRHEYTACAHTHTHTHAYTQSHHYNGNPSGTHLNVSPGHREQVVGFRHGAELCWAPGAPQQKQWVLLSEWTSKAEPSSAAWSSRRHQNRRLPTVDYGENAPAKASGEGLWRSPYIPSQMRLLLASPIIFKDRKPLARVMESPWMQSIFPFLFFCSRRLGPSL